MRFFLFVFALLLFSLKVNSQSPSTENHIKWREGDNLTWEDFQGEAKESSFASAMSDITFSVRIKTEGDLLYIFIESSFNPLKSWVKQEEKSDFLLHHEQTHFNIYEVNARKFRKELQATKLTFSNAEKRVNKLLDKYTSLNVKVQDKYDEETDHSLLKEKQEKWNVLIANKLEELSEYQEVEFYITLLNK